MNILIFGATGGVGRELVAQGLEQGHTVTAFARHPQHITTHHERLAVAQGDIRDAATVDAAIPSHEVVLSALGNDQLTANTVLSKGTVAIMEAMERHGVRRFICISSLGVGDSAGQLGWLYNWLLIPLLLRNIFADKERQEQAIRQSGLDWTIVRPGALSNGPCTQVYRSGFSTTDRSIKARISRADVAHFLLTQLDDRTYVKRAVGFSY